MRTSDSKFQEIEESIEDEGYDTCSNCGAKIEQTKGDHFVRSTLCVGCFDSKRPGFDMKYGDNR